MHSRYIIQLKRRRLNKTNYRKRLALVKTGVPRAVIRKSLMHTRVDIVEYRPSGDRVISHGCTVELRKFGWKGPTGNIPSAYLAGYMSGVRAKKSGVNRVYVDIGLQKPVKGGRLMAAVKGLLDAGIDIPVDEDMLPDKKHLNGEHLESIDGKSIEIVKKAMEELL